jgi:RNA polymerase sigma-70 factor, ECF subfamily
VATKRLASYNGRPHARTNADFLGIFSNLAVSDLRGTSIAMRAVRMENQLNPSIGQTLDTTKASDWLSAHGDYLFNLAVGQVRDPFVAEDLVQETFFAALKARERFSGRSSDRTWLVGILRHKIYDHLRRICRQRPVRMDTTLSRTDHESWDDAVLWAHEVAAECVEPSRRMELDEFRGALEAALGKLPPRIAQVFQLYEVEERPNREVCARLNISENNLWVMLHRARKQLQQELREWWHGEEIRNPKSEIRSKSEKGQMPKTERAESEQSLSHLKPIEFVMSNQSASLN